MEPLYSELSYKIVGAMFKVYNTLGYGYKEKEYQKALAQEFDILKIKYVKELYSNLKYEGKIIAGFYVDFLVEDKIVVELKVAEDIYRKHFTQVLEYLKNYNLELGIIGAFTHDKIITKRVVHQH